MASEIFEIPFRRSTPLTLSTAIKSYISTKYDQHPDMFKVDLEAIDKLRADAVNVLETHVSGMPKLGVYAAQLKWMAGKFPIDIGADFTWYPALGYHTQRPMTQNNLQFERANIVYNMASLYSKLAASSPQSTNEGLKTSYNYYAYAAGVIKYLKEEVIPELRSAPPEDMDAMTLESLEQLMLAQSQESFWRKAVNEGARDAMVSKLAEQVSEYYKLAGEYGVQSSAVSSEWIHRMSAKRHHFAAAAQFRAARDCLDGAKYGEEIARLDIALQQTNYALVESKYLNKVYMEDLRGLKAKIMESLKRADKDNDMIYLNPVPPASSIKPIQKRAVARSIIPRELANAVNLLTDTGAYGAPLFQKLVPYAVHTAASIYTEKRDRLVNTNLVSELEGLTAKLHDMLQSLNLPGSLQALEKPLGLPSGLLAHAEEVRQQNGIDRIIRSMQDIAKLKENNRAMHQEAVDMLAEEEAFDASLREKHGTARWTRPVSRMAAAKIYQQAGEYDGFLKSADQSDGLVRDKVAENEKVLRVLGGEKRELEAFVPNTRRMKLAPKMEREILRLRGYLNEVSRLEARRRRLVEKWKEASKEDDITTDILAEASRLERESPHIKLEPLHFETLFEHRLTSRYDPHLTTLNEEARTQETLISRIQESHSVFVTSRKVDPTVREREKALQTLESTYFKYREIVGNLDTGRTFYNDLAKLLGRFKEDVKAWVYSRMDEGKEVDRELVSAMGSLRISGGNGVGMKPPGRSSPASVPAAYTQKGYRAPPGAFSPSPTTTHGSPHSSPRQVSRPASPPPPSSPPPVQSRTPLPAPVPTRVLAPRQIPSPGLWTGDGTTPIKFAGESPGSRKAGKK